MATKDKPALQFSREAERWFELIRAETEPDDDGEQLEALDRLLLRHKPASDLEIIVLLEVVAEAVRGGGRIDGLEVAALLSVRDRILIASTEAGLGEAYAALQARAPWSDVEHRRSATG